MLGTVLSYLSFSLEFICLIAGLVLYRRLTLPWRLVHALVGLAFFVEVSAIFIIKYQSRPNTLWLYNLYILAEILLLAIPALLLIRRKPATILGGTGIVGVLSIWIYQFSQLPLTQLFSYAYIGTSLLLTALYLSVLIHSALTPEMELRRSEALLCVAMIVYSGCNIPLFGVFNYLAEKKSSYLLLAPIINLLSVVRYACIVAALLVFLKCSRPAVA